MSPKNRKPANMPARFECALAGVHMPHPFAPQSAMPHLRTRPPVARCAAFAGTGNALSASDVLRFARFIDARNTAQSNHLRNFKEAAARPVLCDRGKVSV